jgi:hypothetical protein
LALLERQKEMSVARLQLEEDLMAFLRRMKEGGESALGRNPDSSDLLPYFQRYAWTAVQVSYADGILAAPTLAEAKERMRGAIEKVIRPICRKPDPEIGRSAGTWLVTVRRTCNAVDFGSCRTQYGRYSRTAFMYPKWAQLKVLLQVQGRQLIQEFLELKAGREAAATKGLRDEKRDDSDGTNPGFPKRGEWLKQHLRERGWNKTAFHTRWKGPDRKTTNKILRGEAVSELTLDGVVQALNSYAGSRRFPQIVHSDIPNK